MILPDSISRLWDRWANFHPFLRFVIGSTLVSLFALLTLPPAYRGFKSWRLESNLSAAKTAVETGSMIQARDLSLTVLRAGDPRLDAFRILEASMKALRDPRHSDISRAILSHPDGTRADRLAGFRGLAPAVPMGIVAQAWTKLSEADQVDPEFVAVFADRLVRDRQLTDAASLLVTVPGDPPHPLIRQRLIRVLIASGTREALQEAQKRLAAEWPKDAERLHEWLAIAEEIPIGSLDVTQLGPVRNSLQRHAAKDDAAAALMLVRMKLAANFSSRAAILDEAEAEWDSRAPVEYARFLTAVGMDERLVASFPIERVEEHPALLPMLAEALQNTGRWVVLEILLEEHGDRMQPWELRARRALVARKSGTERQFTDAWAAALGEANSNERLETSLSLYEFAKRAGLEAEAERALIDSIRRGRGPLPLYADLKPLVESLAKRNRENELLQICAAYLPFEPSNPVLLTHAAYLICIHELTTPEVLIKAVKPMAEAFPDAVPMHCVLATLQLSNSDTEGAAETLDRLKLDPAELAPPYRAAYEVTQVLNGRLKVTDPRIKEFPWSALMPTERRHFQKLLKIPVEEPLEDDR
jgi:hypothetical protein